MLKKYGYIGLVFLPVLILLLWVATIEVQIHQGKEVVVRIKGYDPRDLLAGHYIYYQLDWENTDCSQFENGICPTKAFERTGRFYVSEKEAVMIEQELRDDDVQAEIVFSYQRGIQPKALDLLLDGQSWRY